jgi:dihydropteroate synthase
MGKTVTRTYVTPRGLLRGVAARAGLAQGRAWPMPGGHAFTAAIVSRREGAVVSQTLMTRTEYDAGRRDPYIDAELAGIAAPHAAFAGLTLAKPVLMGVLNVTPDSFSDGGRFKDAAAAVVHARAMAAHGAALIDVGGESTRPGAAAVDQTEETQRTAGVIKVLAGEGLRVSIDSRHVEVMQIAVGAGAQVINDITALNDPAALAFAAKAGAAVVLMHMQGEPRTMQDDPIYAWAPGDVHDYLRARINACVAAGIDRARIAIDPGLGFGKTAAHNAELLDHLAMFHSLGCPLVVGASRKSFIGRLSAGEGTAARLPGSLASALLAASKGAQILRVHDVAETAQALAIQGAVHHAGA